MQCLPLEARRCLVVSWKGMAQKRHPLFFRLFSHFSGETQPGTLDSCMQKARLQLSTNRPGFVFNMMDVWSGGKPQARSQTPVYPQERFPLRSPCKRPRHRPPIPRAQGDSPEAAERAALSEPDSACARRLPLEPKLKMNENAFALPSMSGNAPEIHSQ